MSQLKKLLAGINGQAGVSQLDAAIGAISDNMRLSGSNKIVSAKGAGLALGLEDYSDDAVAAGELATAITSLNSVVAGLEGDLTAAQKEAAVLAGAITGDIGRFLATDVGMAPGTLAASNGIGRIAPALESYDEKENRAAAVYTVAYNLQAARQDAFGEAFYPTVVVAPDQQGYHIHINLVNLINGVRRKATGELENWNRHNIVNVIRNPGLINSTSTKIVPVFRAGNESKFVDAAILTPAATEVNGESVQTSALAIGKVFDLIDLSQTDLQLDQGHMDETDSIDTDILMKSIVVKVGDDVLKFPTTHLPGAQFHYPVQGDQQRMDVRLETDALSIGKNTKLVDGSALGDLAPIVTGDLVVYVKTTVTGSVVRDKGETEVNASAVRVVKIIDATGDVHLPSSPAMAAIDVYTFDNDNQEQVFRELTKELRCPKCQNQDIADSNAGLAKDLRDKTYQMVREGKDKEEIVDYMVARYGNFILYNPPLMASTLILWLGPLLVILIGGAVVVMRSRRPPAVKKQLDNALSEEEQRRLAELLKEEEKQ